LPATAAYAGELPFAHDPALHQPRSYSGQKQGLCFIANKDAKRDIWLAQLSASGLIPTVYGNYFMRHPLFWKHPLHFRPSVATQAMGPVYAPYQAALNIHAKVVREGTNMRTFECAGYGIPQLVERRPGLERYFEPDSEILVFSTVEECVAQYERLAGDASLAARLTENARRRVLAEHTYKQRAIVMLKELVTCNQ
jgi:spore maturation protein CgeB